MRAPAKCGALESSSTWSISGRIDEWLPGDDTGFSLQNTPAAIGIMMVF
jgi:hypothetical protein